MVSDLVFFILLFFHALFKALSGTESIRDFLLLVVTKIEVILKSLAFDLYSVCLNDLGRHQV